MISLGLEGVLHIFLVMEFKQKGKVMPKVSSANSNIAVAVAAGAVGALVGRSVWKRIKNRKAKK